MTKKLILGTAGHIDHGKSSLVKALTGVDPDRLSEEKRRGITIELGFAELKVGDIAFGVVDVPGHEKFVRTMVAGATGIDLVMLVIAADEGVMPQTREHLDICALLGIPAGFVVLTKADLVDEEWLELVQEDVREALVETFLEEAPMVVVSSHTGAGLDGLRQTLVQTAKAADSKAENDLARLPVDRVFVQKGFGPVVTGTLVSGRLAIEDQVTLLPGGQSGRIRGLQNHSAFVQEVVAGQRSAVNVQGIELEDIHRGQVLVHAGTLEVTESFDARIRLLPHLPKPLKHRAPLLLHSGTNQIPCRIFLHDRAPVAPGEEAYARIFPEEPTVLLPGDRFILRGFQRIEHHGTTFGGGVVLDPFPTWRRKDPEILERLEILEHGELEERIAALVLDAGPRGINEIQLCQRVGRTAKALSKVLPRLMAQGILVRYEKEPPRFLHEQLLAGLVDQALVRLAVYHDAFPLEEGMPRETLRGQLEIDSLRLFSMLLERLQKAEEIVVDRDAVRLIDHRVRFAEEEEALRQKLLDLYRDAGLTPPRARELPDILDEDERDIRSMLDLLVRREQLARIRDDLYFEASVLDELRQQTVAFLQEHGEMTAQDFKGLTQASRKFSIPLAEYLDQLKVTVRVGEVRRLRRTEVS